MISRHSMNGKMRMGRPGCMAEEVVLRHSPPRRVVFTGLGPRPYAVRLRVTRSPGGRALADCEVYLVDERHFNFREAMRSKP